MKSECPGQIQNPYNIAGRCYMGFGTEVREAPKWDLAPSRWRKDYAEPLPIRPIKANCMVATPMFHCFRHDRPLSFQVTPTVGARKGMASRLPGARLS
jgi:hypothetical protein